MLDERDLLERCNEFRRAGGAGVLDELIPGKAGMGNACLIARNLNFDCYVGMLCNDMFDDEGKVRASNTRAWVIASDDNRLEAAAKAVGLAPARDVVEGYGSYVYVLPRDLTESAIAFDDDRYPTRLYDHSGL